MTFFEYGNCLPFVLSCHNFEKFAAKVAEKGYFGLITIIIMIDDMLEKFYDNKH